LAAVTANPNKGMLTFTIIWAGQLASTLGSGLTSFALGVWVYESTGSTTLFSINMLLWVLPGILFSPLAGVITDRWDRRLVMIFSDTGAGLASIFVILVLISGNLEVWHVYLATFLNSAFSVFQWPAYSAATSLLVPKQQLGRAGGMTQIGDAISHLATPVIAGGLYVTVGLNWILAIDVFSYLVAVSTLAAVHFPAPEKTAEGQKGKGSFWQEAIFGWRYIRQRKGLFGLLTVFASMNFLISSVYLLITPMILDMSSPATLGVVDSIAGAGMLAGTLVMSIWGGPKRRIFGIIAAEMVAGFSSLVMGIRPSIPLISVAAFGVMFGMPISNANSQAIWQTKVAQDIQGRVFSIRRMIAMSMEPLAFALSGLLAERFFEPLMAEGGQATAFFGPVIGVGPGRGIGLMIVISGILYMLAAGIILLHPRIRRVEIELPDAIEG